jgi:hypothetical protein
MSEEEEIEENEETRHLGREQLARSLLRYLTQEELTQCTSAEILNSHAVLDRFEAVYESGLLKMDDGGDYGQETCSCGHEILYIYYIKHKSSGQEIMVGSRCILRFDHRLKVAMAIRIRENEFLNNPEAFCKLCKRRNAQGDHITCSTKKRKAEEAEENAKKKALDDIRLQERLKELELIRKTEKEAQKKAHEIFVARCNKLEKYATRFEGHPDIWHERGWFFDVPFNSNATVKGLGLRFDGDRKKWYTLSMVTALRIKDAGFKLIVFE